MGLWSTELTGGVLVATYTCAPMNYMCGEGISELAQLIETWREPEIRAVVLTGGLPGRFVTHYSAEELLHIMEDPEMLRAIGPAGSEAYYGVLHALEQLPKPVVAAINGDAMGGGLEICLACDLRICQNGDYRLGLPEVKAGLIPGGSGTQRLPRIVGLGKSLDLILRGRLLRPEEALSFGLVHEVVDDALARAREIAKEMAGLSPVALACAKHAVYAGADFDLKSGLSIEAEAFLRAASSDDARAASRAYVAVPFEKRRGWMESPKGVQSGRS